MHRHQDAALRGFQPVAHIRQCPADDDAHGVAEIAVFELILDVQSGQRRQVAVAAGSRGTAGGVSTGGISSGKVVVPHERKYVKTILDYHIKN